jgi:mono/diheme cytochrome c family protein
MWCRGALLLTLAALEPCSTQAADAALEAAILNGYRRYHGTCSHCHGPDGRGGSFAPSLIETQLPFPRFEAIVRDGVASGTSVMQGFADDPNLAPYIGDIYAYLRARAEGVIGRGRPVFGE